MEKPVPSNILVDTESHGVEQMPTDATLTVVSLGEGNIGSIGAKEIPPSYRATIIKDAGSSEYRRPASNRFKRVDGRTPEGGFGYSEGTADPQVAGSEPISGSAADMSVAKNPERLSVLVAKNTKETIAAGYEVIVHGDDHKEEGGCGAAVNERSVLRANAQNVDIVAPLTWSVAGLLKLDDVLSQDDVVEFITTGGENAEKDELWDATPEESIAIAIENGASYQRLVGPHKEGAIKVDVEEGKAHDEETFKKDHVLDDGTIIEIFAATFGEYKKMVFEKYDQNGGTKRDAALHVAAAVAFNVGVCKHLTAKEEEPETVAAGRPGTSLKIVVVGAK